MDKSKQKKIINTILNVILIFFLVICIAVVAITLLAGRDPDGAANIFGYQLRIVTSSSMEECEYTNVSEYDIKSIPVKSMVLIEKVPTDSAEVYDWYDALEKGDVLTFKYVDDKNAQVTITHRITKITKQNDGFVIELQGDNKNSEKGAATQIIDTTVPNNPNYVIGKVKGQFIAIGNIITLLKTPLGVVLMVIIPCLAIIFYEAIKIFKTVQADKKEKVDSVLNDKEREIEELKKKLEEMSAAVTAQAEEMTDENQDAATENSNGEDPPVVEGENADEESVSAESDVAADEETEETTENESVEEADEIAEEQTSESVEEKEADGDKIAETESTESAEEAAEDVSDSKEGKE